MAASPAARRVLAVSSGGGHWVQLLRLRPAFVECEVTYATVSRVYQAQVPGASFHVIPDCNRAHKLRALWCAARIFVLVVRLRPEVVVSTGAAPGYFALRFARWLGADTIWVDSLANADELSGSGRIVRPYARLWLTQWPHLASPKGPRFEGSVL